MSIAIHPLSSNSSMAGPSKSEEFVYDSESGSEYDDVAYEKPKHFAKYELPPHKSSMKGKEMWLIKTPRGFPLSQLKTLPVSFASKKISNDGVKTFDLNDAKYQANEDSFASDAAKYVIIDHEKVHREISRFYTIREVVAVPEINYEKEVKPREDVQKLTGLKMRHFATGYSAKDFTEAQPIAESRLDEDGKVLAQFRGEKRKLDESESAPEKREKREKHKKADKEKKLDKKKKKKAAVEA